MKLSLAAASFLLLPAAAVAAADMLPLARGIYVRVGVPCKGASNVDLRAYLGDNNGINDQQTGCKIDFLEKDASTYSLKRTCTSLRFGSSFVDEVKVTIIDRTSFTYHRPALRWTKPVTYRFCGTNAQF